MQQYIAFLRGINVGGHRVKMTDLRAQFEELGFTNVATFIASGNVIFEAADADTARLQAQIEQQLQQALGYTVATFLRSRAEVAAIAAYEPFAQHTSDVDVYTVSIMLLAQTPPDDLHQQLAAFETPLDAFHVHDREIYWLCRAKTTESLVDWALVGKTVSLPPVTVRNATTIRKLAAKYPPT
ncbi:MAG: DUF1697 domain-containing protein [Chloroflexi bacterium]|nr:DUF1697 domain-containing protein [Chloroflexota bacterium]